MNVHLPQTEEARAEAMVLMGVSYEAFSTHVSTCLDRGGVAADASFLGMKGH